MTPSKRRTEIAGHPMTLAAGSRLGPYEILAPLGAGGMGEVYRARDTRLAREVAIKVLPAELASDASRLKRFEKEARSASALNHPNIVTIFDIGSESGVSYIAMEWVDGVTLRERVARGAMPIRKLLPIAIEVAEGLAAAHDAGIVHRDLKPENVMVTRDGLTKILDFGLAKPSSTISDGVEGSRLPTMTETSPGTIMGTAGYMSPEQAMGKPVDFRSDQFSLGAILYEMATGRRAFHRGSAPETLTAVIREDPEPIAALNPEIPAALRWIVERCLAKEPRQRYSSTDDLARDLAGVRDHLSEAAMGSGAFPGVKLSPRRQLRWIAAGALLLIAGALGYILAIRAPRIEAPHYAPVTFNRGTVTYARFTPDGQSVVYSATWDGKPRELCEIYTTRLGNPESVSLGLPPAHLLSIARNGDMAILMDSVARGTYDLGTVARAPLGGGAPRQIAKSVSDADWGPGGELAVLRWNEDESQQALEYPAGKILHEVRNPKGGSGGPWMQSPRVSPDGRLVAFIEHPLTEGYSGAVAVVDLAGRKRVISAGWAAVSGLNWSPRGDELWFTAGGRTDTPDIPIQMAIRTSNLSGKERVVITIPGLFVLRDRSREGRLLISRETWRNKTVFGGQGLERERDLSWSDTIDEDAKDLSADGKTLLFSCASGACLRGTDGGPVVRLGAAYPIGLSPDGKWVSAQTRGSDGSEILTLLPTGPGDPKPLNLPGLEGVTAFRWFPDSRHFVVSAKRGKQDRRCFLADLEGGVPRPLTPEGAEIGSGRGFTCWPSPDGQWVTARPTDDTLALYPVGSGEARFVRGIAENDKVVAWSADSRSLYIQTLNREWPIRVFRFDVQTGKRELWKEFVPSDAAGADSPQGGSAGVRITQDGRFYTFSFRIFLSELYVVDRAR